MSYLVLARKWRPQTFADVVGQRHVTETLRNAIRRGRIPHAILFTGVRGVGKTTIARILARALNCQSGDGPAEEPCGTCRACQQIVSGAAVDVSEIDGASNNSVDDVRALRENAQYRPAALRTKIYIVDEVHMLSRPAFNALLKVLEEPPAHVIFLFATTDPQRIPVTILSRCQRYDLKRIRAADIGAQLGRIAADEGFSLGEETLRVLAHQAEGSMRDALSLLDQVISFAGDEPTAEQVREILGAVDRSLVAETVDGLLAGDGARVLDLADRVLEAGHDPKLFLGEVATELRNLAVARLCPDRPDLLDLEAQEAVAVLERARQCAPRQLDLLFALAGRGVNEVAAAGQPRLALEMVLVRMLHAAPLEPLDEVLERLDRLVAGGGTPSAAAGGPGRGSAGASGGRPMPRARSAPARSASRSSRGASSPEPRPDRRGDDGARRPPAADAANSGRPAPAPAGDEPPREEAPPPAGATAPGDSTAPALEPATAPPSPADWREFLRAVRRREDPGSAALSAALENAHVERLDDQRCVLALAQPFFRQEVEKRRALLGELLTQRYGQALQIEITRQAGGNGPTVAEERAASRQARRDQRRREVLGHPGVRGVQEILGGEVVEVHLREEEE